MGTDFALINVEIRSFRGASPLGPHQGFALDPGLLDSPAKTKVDPRLRTVGSLGPFENDNSARFGTKVYLFTCCKEHYLQCNSLRIEKTTRPVL